MTTLLLPHQEILLAMSNHHHVKFSIVTVPWTDLSSKSLYLCD